ncbi:MAG: sodium-solute symporter, partial [Bacteroidota bacterium]
LVKDAGDRHYLNASRWSTAAWGVFCTVTALYAGRLGNLIEVVNVLGSLFYGTILGIFLTAFFLKKIKGNAVFLGALAGELIVLAGWYSGATAFLWLNLIGCAAVMTFAWLFQLLGKVR